MSRCFAVSGWFAVLSRSFLYDSVRRRLPYVWAFMLGLTPLWPALAAGSDLPTRTEIQNRLDTLNKQKSLTSVDKLTQQDLTQTLDVLDSIDRVRQETSQLKQQAAQAPAKLKQVNEDLVSLGGTAPVSQPSLDSLSLKQLEARLNETLDDLQSAQENLSTYNSQLISLQTQPERVQSALYAASQRSQQLRTQLSGLDPSQEPLRPSQQVLLQVEQALVGLQMEQQRKSLEVNTTMQDLLQKQRDYTAAQIGQLEHMVQMLQGVINNKRLNLSEKTAKEAQNSDELQRIQENPLVKTEMETNRQLSQRLIKATEAGNTLVQESIQVKNWLDRATQSERNLKEQITVLKGSLLLSRILYQQQQNLPSADAMGNISTQIADLRLEQFDINQQRDVLFRGDEYIQQLVVHSSNATVDAEVTDALEQILDMRRELLDQLNKQLGNQLMLAINLQISRQQLMSVNDSLQRTLTQQIFWVSSNKPMDWNWLKDLPSTLKQQIKNLRFNLKGAQLGQGIMDSLLLTIPALIMVGLLLWRRKSIDSYMSKLADDVGQLKRDSQLHTPKAILLLILRTLPGVLVILSLGLWLKRTDSQISSFAWLLSENLALFWMVFATAWFSLKPGSLSERHFNIPASRCAHYRRQTLRLGGALLPLMFWAVVGEKTPLYLVDDAIGQIIIVCNLLLLTILVFPVCRDCWREKERHTVQLIVVTMMAAMPLFLIGLMLNGFFYTTLRLASRWVDSLYLLIVWNIVYFATIRGLSVAARRLAYRRAVARRQNLVKEGAEGSEPVPEAPLALEQISQQSLRLTTMVLFLAFSGAFYWIWADLVTVFSYLDSITLWHYSTTSASGTVLQPVTLGNLLVAMVIGGVAYVMTRNLPGLLEVLVLSRLQLRQGTSYAITTVLTYLITAVGAVTSLSSLGVSWDKLQWLVAALSVGLGFGLQEIFANFVSGLIILFERPVRIGDTITIGAFSGSVSKIRIRATTITDFDRKEVIIPNKAFVTERLINWSLSDTITRVLIRIGVAYGSDLDKVKEVLLQAARDNPRVMTDPEPQVFFLSFGASSLDHELRLYVRELRDRSYTVDELNRTIDRLCRENNINIAFNQLEVYLHNAQGKEVQEVSRELTQPPM
ncbi:mechanosensitive channel MscK [Dickeya solani]|uniref:Mechanosensitive channel MscK n=1 Tax=Dickeya solani TaxID=1089444 RepID=A0ABU4ECA4_9GAMM|nr:mechanosensitive channel MscK [Dickeya solani]MCA6997846.1 mechanosensitive channel MscK [Dickeya solani]MCZ0786226.1 mechanosensitive channel MscK [Dickeya solani]MCZ0789618.1 mechanosensitive channel MscK [Dickeya solani]MCZ0798243.1 mechanosensitive channel MscK [Dickeya solani]MCZ0801940.1 mechanosensitive channel MscK [Dickeya solani]